MPTVESARLDFVSSRVRREVARKSVPIFVPTLLPIREARDPLVQASVCYSSSPLRGLAVPASALAGMCGGTTRDLAIAYGTVIGLC